LIYKTKAKYQKVKFLGQSLFPVDLQLDKPPLDYTVVLYGLSPLNLVMAKGVVLGVGVIPLTMQRKF
jgi:hypothetical protein